MKRGTKEFYEVQASFEKSVNSGMRRRMSKIEDAARQAEQLGFAKYVSDNGASMVIATQEEIDAVIAQAVKADRETNADGTLCA